jgi:hypothetical protein
LRGWAGKSERRPPKRRICEYCKDPEKIAIGLANTSPTRDRKRTSGSIDRDFRRRGERGGCRSQPRAQFSIDNAGKGAASTGSAGTSAEATALGAITCSGHGNRACRQITTASPLHVFNLTPGCPSRDAVAAVNELMAKLGGGETGCAGSAIIFGRNLQLYG